MGSRRWWAETIERMVKTAAQTLLWQMMATMTLLSLATSILTTKMGPDKGSPSLV